MRSCTPRHPVCRQSFTRSTVYQANHRVPGTPRQCLLYTKYTKYTLFRSQRTLGSVALPESCGTCVCVRYRVFACSSCTRENFNRDKELAVHDRYTSTRRQG